MPEAVEGIIPIFSCLIFREVRWAAHRSCVKRQGFSGDADGSPARRCKGEVLAAERVRVRGEELHPQGIKGELDLVGYGGDTLAFVGFRTCSARKCSKIPLEHLHGGGRRGTI